MPEFIQKIATGIGSPLEKAKACCILGFNYYVKERQQESDYYYQKGLKIIEIQE